MRSGWEVGRPSIHRRLLAPESVDAEFPQLTRSAQV